MKSFCFAIGLMLLVVVVIPLAVNYQTFDPNPPPPQGTHWHKNLSTISLYCDVDGVEIGTVTYASNMVFIWHPFMGSSSSFEDVHRAKEYLAANAACEKRAPEGK